MYVYESVSSIYINMDLLCTSICFVHSIYHHESNLVQNAARMPVSIRWSGSSRARFRTQTRRTWIKSISHYFMSDTRIYAYVF
jgi:hypothetical protein